MSEEEIYDMLMEEKVDKYPLLNEIFAIRDNRHKLNDYTICVNGYISLDVINRGIKKQKEIEKQNKIIDLMSKELTNIIDATEEEIKECFRRKVEE